ncbi:tetratricopeptide repeat protein [Streptomyces sp. DSM 110735]|uniref:tetratricopeptide repeat protein n=1 Tax=Streptomyces sp. DSM 110735 TaxID=2775031 RepID=UPI0018F498E7|nr:tetratricopeptide repeat protein [Streptomyces sp. DSM 110735]MBJ7901794.1 tetratricopeptide repeat protein [Streptomyces sp. DSM 110735]
MSALFDRRPRPAADASGAGAIAAGGSIAQAMTGPGAIALHIENVGMLLPDACPPAESVSCPPRLTNLPFRAELFVGRGGELGLLRAASATPGRPLAQVLRGLGGIGKSTLAARWAVECGPTHAPVWWIRAGSRSAIDAGIADLADALQPSLAPLLPPEQRAEWGRRWLASHSGWLLVLDNVTNPDDVEPLLSRAPSGRFLITSQRATGWHGVAEEIPLDVLSCDDAVRLFTRVRGGEDSDAAELCEELGCLPLAVTQAAAYCLETDCTVRVYLDDLAASPGEMYAETHEGGDHERTIARVWHVTLDRLADDPLAVRILLTMAWYAPDGIPRDLFAHLGTPLAVRRALGRLAAHSMITFSGDTVAVHRLVQAVSRTCADGDRHRSPEAIGDACAAAVEALARAVPEDIDDPSAWHVMRSLLPHVQALAEHVRPEEDTAAMAYLLTRTGDYMLGAGMRVAGGAYGLLRRAEAACVRHHGLEGEQTLDTRVLLARATRMLKTTEEAAPVAEEVLADCTRVLGPDHEVTLSAMSNMHQVASLQGDTERALRLAEECLAGIARLRGAEARSTFEARNRLVMALMAVGEMTRADDLCDELLADSTRVLGEEDPATLSARSLRTTLDGQRKLPETLIKLLAGVHSVGEEDEEGLIAALRVLVQQVGAVDLEQFVRATEEDVSAAERDLDTCRRVLGDDHVDTVVARLVLFQVYGATQDPRYAEPAKDLLMEAFSVISANESAIAIMLRMFSALRTVIDELPRPPDE